MKTMYFAAFIPEADGGYHIAIPDIPHCFTEAETLDEGMEAAEEVVAMQLRWLASESKEIPVPSGLVEMREKTAAYLREIDHEASGEILYQLIAAPDLNMTW